LIKVFDLYYLERIVKNFVFSWNIFEKRIES